MLMVSRRYRLATYLTGSALARTADEMSAPALLLVGMSLGVAASVPPLLVACLTASAAAGGPVLGALLDRSTDPGRFLGTCLLLYAVGVGLVCTLLGVVHPVALAVVAFGAGLVGPSISGGWTSQLPGVVPAPSLPRAQSLDATTFSLAGLVGPGMAGVAAVTVGPWAGVATVVVLLLVAAVAATRLPRVARHTEKGQVSTHLVTQIRSGVSAIARIAPLRSATLASCVAFVAIGAFDVLAPRIGAETLGGAGQGALLLSAAAIGAGATTITLARLRPDVTHDRMLAIGLCVTAVGFALVAVPAPVTVVAGTVMIGVGDGPTLVALIGIRHRDAPAAVRAQVFTTGASLKITAASIGAALSGVFVTRPLPELLAAGAVLHVVAALVAAVSPYGRRADRDQSRNRPGDADRRIRARSRP